MASVIDNKIFCYQEGTYKKLLRSSLRLIKLCRAGAPNPSCNTIKLVPGRLETFQQKNKIKYVTIFRLCDIMIL